MFTIVYQNGVEKKYKDSMDYIIESMRSRIVKEGFYKIYSIPLGVEITLKLENKKLYVERVIRALPNCATDNHFVHGGFMTHSPKTSNK